MPVGARRGHQRSNTVDQLQGRQSQLVSSGTALVTGRLAVLFGEYLFGLVTLQEPPAHKSAQDAPTQAGLHFSHNARRNVAATPPYPHPP